MRRFVLGMVMLTLGLCWGPTLIRAGGGPLAQPPRPPSTFGAHLKPVPPLLYDHLPQLKRGQGLAVENVQPNSFAERSGLRANDILLNYEGTELTSSKQLHDLLRGSNPRSPGSLALLRGGKEMKVDVVLTPSANAAVKRGGPPAIDLTATPMRGGKLKVTFEYYADADSGKLRRLTCTGSLQQIEEQVPQLPERLQDLARVALKRLRAINSP